MADDDGPQKEPLTPAPAPGNAREDEDIDQVPLYRKKRVLIPFALLILALAFGAWYWYKNLRNFVSTDDAYIDANKVSLSAKVLGRIVVLTVDEGDRVKQGDLLVRLDDTDLRAQMDQAKANITLAQDSLALAKVNVDRTSDEYGIAVSKIAVAKSQLGVLETQLANMTLVAPFDGIVAKRWLLPGDVVQPGQPVLTIYDTRLIWVTANLEETKLGRVKLRDHVEINVDTYPRRPFGGTVGLIGDYTASQFSLIPPNNASGNFTKVTQRVPLKIYLDDPTPETKAATPLRPGMSVEIKIRVR